MVGSVRNILCLALLVGTVAVSPALAKDKVAGTDWNPPKITAERAVELFSAVCGGSLPHFKNAKKLMAANGIVLASPYGTKTVYSEKENVSFQIQEDGGNTQQCSMVFESKQGKAAVKKAFSALGETKVVEGTLAAFYQGRTVALMDPDSSQGAYHFLMLSER